MTTKSQPSADAPLDKSEYIVGLFDHIKKDEVNLKKAREGISVRGNGQFLARLTSTSLWHEKNQVTGKPLAGKARYKALLAITGFGPDDALQVNPDYKNPRGWRPARIGDEITLFAQEEAQFFAKSDLPRLIGAAVAAGVIEMDGTSLVGNEADIDKAFSDFFTNIGENKGCWVIGRVATSIKRKQDKATKEFTETLEAFELRQAEGDGFATVYVDPIDDDLLGEMVQAASGVENEEQWTAFVAENGLADESGVNRKACLALLRGLDKAQAKAVVEAVGFKSE